MKRSDFPERFQKLTGQNLDSYMRNASQNTGNDVAGALAMKSGNTEAAKQLASVLNDYHDKQLAYARLNEGSTAYASAGGGSKRGGKGGRNDLMAGFSDILKNMMGGGLPGAKKEDPAAAAARLNMANRKISSTNGKPIEEDASISIFDRVSDRYSMHTQSVAGGSPEAWTLPTNRASHGLNPRTQQ